MSKKNGGRYNPTNPQNYPRVHGRKPPAPPTRTGRNMGKSSSSATNPQLAGIIGILAFLPMLAIAMIFWEVLA